MSLAMAELFQRIITGVYVVGVAAGEQRNAFTAAWVMPVSFQPLMLALSINPRHSSYALLRQGGVFSINVLGTEQRALAARFGAPADTGKLASVNWQTGRTGAPLLEDAVARFECRVSGELPAGDHVLVLGRVIDGLLLKPDAGLLTYRDTGDLDGASKIFPAGFESR